MSARNEPARSADAKLNKSPYSFEAPDGKTYTIPSYGAFLAGDFRKVRDQDAVAQTFSLLESVCDEETLAAIDSMDIERFGDFANDWPHAAGVDAKN